MGCGMRVTGTFHGKRSFPGTRASPLLFANFDTGTLLSSRVLESVFFPEQRNEENKYKW